MEQTPITTILLAPMGAGKSTRVEKLREKDATLVHFERDDIHSGLIREFKRVSVEPTDDDYKRIHGLTEKQWFASHARAFAAKTPYVVVDYVPINPSINFFEHNDWVSKIIALSKQEKRRVILEGVSADPEITWSRVLQRTSRFMTLSQMESERMNPDGVWFRRHFLPQYQTFPGQFLRAAECADVDEARLYDNSKGSSQLIGEWAKGQRLAIHDEAAYAHFENMGLINLNTANFEARVTESHKHNSDITSHTFGVNFTGLYGLSDRPAAGSSSPQASARVLKYEQ